VLLLLLLCMQARGVFIRVSVSTARRSQQAAVQRRCYSSSRRQNTSSCDQTCSRPVQMSVSPSVGACSQAPEGFSGELAWRSPARLYCKCCCQIAPATATYWWTTRACTGTPWDTHTGRWTRGLLNAPARLFVGHGWGCLAGPGSSCTPCPSDS
jgi:hypothetical protein